MKIQFFFALALSAPFVHQSALAQAVPLKYHIQSYALDTGFQSGRSGDTTDRVAYSTVVTVPGAPWLRLTFSEAALGRGSYLTVTSLYDHAQQRLTADALAQWQNTSAFFNGEALKVELHVAPGDTNVFVRMRELMVGIEGIESQCGNTDDRVPSTDPRSGRFLNIGCTAWLIADGRFVSAGHCTADGGLANIVEFNVPPSLPNGTIQHPGPEDQYNVNTASRVFHNNSIGDDWGVFATFANSQTGLTALQAQGAWYDLAQDLGPATIRITGYGVDSGTANQTEQTSTGPNAGSSGTTMRYRTDTEGGNSGSPVIDEATGRSVGVHTNAGCTISGGFNTGTSMFNTSLWDEVGGGGGGEIELMALVRRRGSRRTVALRWNPADGGTVNVLRDGNIVQTTADDGKTVDNLGATTGTFTYEVCETDSGDCSNEVVVQVTGP